MLAPDDLAGHAEAWSVVARRRPRRGSRFEAGEHRRRCNARNGVWGAGREVAGQGAYHLCIHDENEAEKQDPERSVDYVVRPVLPQPDAADHTEDKEKHQRDLNDVPSARARKFVSPQGRE